MTESEQITERLIAADAAQHRIKPRLLTTDQAGERLQGVQISVAHLKAARHELRKVGATSAAAYVQRAIKSAEGAVRHAQRILGEAQRGDR